MKRNIHKNLLGMLKSKGILAISGGLLLVSCGAQMGGYSETDGVYYDPNKDTLPEGVIINDSGNRVGEYYDYYQDDSNVIQNAEANSKEGRYSDWNNYNWNTTATDSDWGSYAGSRPTITTIPGDGDLLGVGEDGMAAIILIGVGAATGLESWTFLGMGRLMGMGLRLEYGMGIFSILGLQSILGLGRILR
jgi:hypothetical protein